MANFQVGQTVFNTTLQKWQTLTRVSPKGNLYAMHNGRERNVSPYSLMTQAQYEAKQAQDPETTCCVCGRNIHDTTPLTGKEGRQHKSRQAYDGFKRGNAIVHYTQREREQATAEFLVRMDLVPPTPANTLETPVAGSGRASRDTKWWALEKRCVAAYPESAWLVTLAVSYFVEGNHLAGSDALASFRRDVRHFEAAQREAHVDFRAYVQDALRPAM